MSEIRDKVKKIAKARIESQYPGETLEQWRGRIADGILSIPELAIVDRKAKPPIRFLHPDDKPNVSYGKAQEDMLKAGWVREIKD